MGAVGQILKELMFGKTKNNKQQKTMNNVVLTGPPQTQRPETCPGTHTDTGPRIKRLQGHGLVPMLWV